MSNLYLNMPYTDHNDNYFCIKISNVSDVKMTDTDYSTDLR